MDATKNIRTMLDEATRIRVGIYGIKGGEYNEFVDDMKTLKDSLWSSKGRSNEYKQLCNAIKEASEMNEKTRKMSDEQKADAFANANIKVVIAVQKYVKGKETVRISGKGNDAFLHSMDALAIVSKYTKQEGKVMNESVVKVIDKINEVRKDGWPHQYSRFESRYGASRAKHAHQMKVDVQNSKKNKAIKRAAHGM